MTSCFMFMSFWIILVTTYMVNIINGLCINKKNNYRKYALSNTADVIQIFAFKLHKVLILNNIVIQLTQYVCLCKIKYIVIYHV